MQRGTSVTQKTIVAGDIPVISGGQKPAYYCNTANRTGETITVAGSGAYAGYVQFWTTPIFVCDAFSIKGKDEIVLTKYLFYALQSLQQQIYATHKEGGVPHVHISSIENFEISVPPLPVQEEIVRILDKFTELEAELAQELARRKLQYTFYRDQLLNFESTIKMRTVQQLIAEQLINIVTPSFKIKRNDYCESGLVPIISQEAEYISGYFDKKDSKITKRNYVCFGDHSEHIKFIDFEFVQGADGLKIMYTNESGLLSKYLYYALSNFYTRRDNYERHFKYLTDTTIPVPSVDVQQRLVNVLDNFDVICSDLSIGLPAEISARQKQYEYYRDLLFEYAANGLNYSRAQQSTAELTK